MNLTMKHILTSEDKLRAWGYGEWLEEPDLVEFEHLGIKCSVIRVHIPRPNALMFGGHLCGYCLLPEGHPWLNMDDIRIPCDVHGGITYRRDHKIGFDCAHSTDLVPSCRFNTQIRQEILDKFHLLKIDPGISEPTYKNINFCIEECKSMAQQIVEALAPK